MPGKELFDVAVGAELGMRHFAYTDALTTNLRDYQLGAAPALVAGGAVYPFLDVNAPLLRNLGIVGSFGEAMALRSRSSDASSMGTRWERWYGGGRLRLRAGSVVVGLSGGYGSESFTFDSTDPATNYPAASYRFVRGGGDVRVPIGRFAVTAEGAYLDVLSAGDLAARFPHATVNGVDLALGGVVVIGGGVEARLGASYRRFFYAMNPRPGEAFVAGGALDELWGLQARLAYVY